ncbi:bloodthirsty-related gene family, member 2 isoform X3 [Perca fluviatilis]|uniref:bloodthirsty-related gene family, member 2 isoform X3 n=1 Tax=Perca fluviatilis TaxID=8168 RepID=UPI001962FA4C|nr:bloodthirsty-related gene family, member 2 isoform X3 [Perca fluviatilis]
MSSEKLYCRTSAFFILLLHFGNGVTLFTIQTQHSLKCKLIEFKILKRTEKSFLVLLTLSCHCHFQSMASTISLLPEKHFLCSLCRDIFTSPVTIPCGHSFCLSCLSHYWTRHQSKYCPHCKRLFTDKPDLSVNRILAEVSHNYRTARPQKPPDEEMNIVPTICPSEMKDWSKVTIETDPCVGVTRRALADIMEKIKVEVNRLSKSELKRIEKYTVDVNLSAKTAHPFLSVSDDRKQVRHTDKLQEVPDNPKRFDRVANVLAKESLSSGRCYWEVEVGEKIEWNLGVVRQSINRKGKFTVCPANGFWTLSLKAGGQFIANTSPVTPLALEQRPWKVGVFLDYTEGRVSFYCAESGVHIHTFTDTFTDRLHPFFSPGRLHGGKNSAPLIISSSFCSI